MAKSCHILDIIASGKIFNTKKVLALTKEEIDKMRTEVNDSRAAIRKQYAESQIPPKN